MSLHVCVILALLGADPKTSPPPMVTSDSDVKVSTTPREGKPSTSTTSKTEPGTTAPRAEPAATTSTEWSPPSGERVFGGVEAPAALGEGAMAFYGIAGAPEVGAGYRQGFSPLELDAKAMFNYLELSVLIEGGLRVPVLTRGRFSLAPAAGIGIKVDSGAKYFEAANFKYVGLRLRLSMHASYKFSDTVAGVGVLEVPWAIAMGRIGHQVTPTIGGGAEFYVGSNLSLLVTAHVGVDAIKEPLGVQQYRPAWAIRLGIGYRLF